MGATNDHIAQLRDLGQEAATTHNNALFFIHGNGVLHLLPGRFVPYVSPGLGILGTIEQTSKAYNYGGGLKIFATRRFAFRPDARRYHADLEATLAQTVQGPGLTLVEIPERYRDPLGFTEISVGFSFSFPR